MGFTGTVLLACLACLGATASAVNLPVDVFGSLSHLAGDVPDRLRAGFASDQLNAQEVHARAQANLASTQLSAQEALARAQANLASTQLSAQEALARAQASLASAPLSAHEAHARAQAYLGAAQLSAQEALARAQANLGAAQLSAQEAQARAQVAIGELAVFASQSKSSSSTTYTLKKSRLTISRHVGLSKVKPPSIIVRDAAASGMICVPLDSIDALEVISVGGTSAEGEVVSGGEAAGGGVKVPGSEQSGKLVGEELQKSVKPVQIIGQGQGIVVTVNGVGSTSVYSGQEATASAGQGGATASTGQGGATASTGQGGATASTGQGGATASTGQGGANASTGQGGATTSVGYVGVTLSTGQESSASMGHEEFVSTQDEVVTEHGENSATAFVNDVTSSGGPEASEIETFSSVGEYSGTHDASLVSGDGSSTDAGHVQTSSGQGVSASAGGASVSAGGASASAGGVSASAGGASASAGGASASAGGASASAGGASASAGGVSASAGGASASAGGASASVGGGRATASSDHGAFASSSSGHSTLTTASSGHGASVTSGGSRGGYSATLSGSKIFVSSPTGGGAQSHLVTTGTHSEHGSAAAAGDGYTHTTSSGSGSSSVASVGSDGRVSLDVSGPHAEAAAVCAGGSAVHLSSAGGLTHLGSADCECVSNYLCDEDGYINTSGAGTINIRSFSLGGQAATVDTRCGADRVYCRHREQREPVGWAPRSCGTRSPVRLDGRVVSGEATRLGEFPWMVAVKRVVPATAGEAERHEYLCGGSLIAPNVVLTGAHCVKKHRAERLVVRVGEWDTNSADTVYPHRDLAVAEVVIHDQFDAETLWYDAALLRLETPAETSAHVNTLCLPGEDDYYIDYSDCFSTGWGQESFDKAVYSSLMKKVPLSKVDSGQCEARMRQTRLGAWFRLHETFLCAGGHPRVDTCKGDGGAPLFCRDTSPAHEDEETFVQIGIVAWGINCHRGGFPGVYADVIKLLPWIRSVLSELSDDIPGAVY